jgi:DNA repair exonuclease SbcCD ATPase subunit
MEQEKTMIETNKVKIPPYAKIKVYWDDKPENYSRECRARVKKYFSKKYGIPAQNINVVYRPVKIDKSGKEIKIDGATIDNIMSVPYQRSLFKEWLTREGKDDVDFDRIIALDEKVNGELNIDLEESLHRKYRLKWLMVNNFLSFGKDNYFPVDNYKGFTVINSQPANQGGKTTLTIDAVKFLFFGTTTKTDKNVQVFNQFNEEKDLIVRGMMEIEGEDEFIIERHLERKPKRKGGWNVSNKLSYYRILPDGEEEEMNDEDAKKTTTLIKDTVGTEKDFDLVVLATSKNLDDLVDSTAGESGKLLTRFIGLEVLSLKESAVRKMHNDFTKTMKSNLYDIETLKEEIENHKANLETLATEKADLDKQLDTEKKVNKKLQDKKIELVGSKEKINEEILSLNPTKLEEEITNITNTGKTYASKVKELEKQITEIGTIDFDEDKDFRLNKDKGKLTTDIAVKKAEIVRLQQVVDDLVKGGICQACNRKLDDVDNTVHINEHNSQIETLTRELGTIERKLEGINAEITAMADTKKKIDDKNKLELQKDRLEVDIDGLRVQLKEKNGDLKKYKANLSAIEKNKEIDIEISQVDTKIVVSDTTKEKINDSLKDNAVAVSSNTRDIETKEKLIVTINKEKEIDKIFKIYIDMIGKKGISKLILRSVLPIINGELQRLLEDITDFEVEVFIDDKNEVRYLLIKDGVEKPLKSGSGFELTASSIALRCVLGKMSSLPTPNFIVFDEVMGRVAADNLANMKPLFERVSDMFDIVFFITQNDMVKDWADKIITVIKENNISKIK